MDRTPYDRATRFDVSEPEYTLFRKYRETNYGNILPDDLFKLGHGQYANRPYYTETAQQWDNFMAGFLAAKPARVEITEEMVERGAKALRCETVDANGWDDLPPNLQASWKVEAKAVLTAALSTAPAKDGES